MNFECTIIIFPAEFVFIHSDFSLIPLQTNDFSLNHKNLYYTYMNANFSANREKLELRQVDLHSFHFPIILSFTELLIGIKFHLIILM